MPAGDGLMLEGLGVTVLTNSGGLVLVDVTVVGAIVLTGAGSFAGNFVGLLDPMSGYV